MGSLVQKLVIMCIFLVLRLKTMSSQVTPGSCLIPEAKPGRCVDIDHCPFLRDLAIAEVLSKQNMRLLKKRVCGPGKVCCEVPSDAASEQDTTPTPGRKMTLPNTTVCGLDTRSVRFYNGATTDLEQFPWAVALEYRNKNPPVVDCGGCLINTRYVITAAHCVEHVQKEDLIARIGDYDLQTDPDCDEDGFCNPKVIKSEIAEIKIHFEYRQKQNDIALLKLQNVLSEDLYVIPICLPQSEDLMHDLFINRIVYVSGWEELRSSIKMHTILVTISMDECQSEFQLSDIRHKLYDNLICTKPATELVNDACVGDSGGPLMISIKENWYLIGVVSFGSPCETPTLPGVYTRVTSFMGWIKENLVD